MNEKHEMGLPKTSSTGVFSPEDLLVKCLNWDQKGLHWAMLSVIPSERALWRSLDAALGELRWRMIFSELGDEMLCSLSHVDGAAVITRQGFCARGANAGLSLFLSAVKAAQMFGVGAELLTLPHIAVGLRPTDLTGRTVKDCFHVSRVETQDGRITDLEIADQYRRPRWPAAAAKTSTKTKTAVTKTTGAASRQTTVPKCSQQDHAMLKRIDACSSGDDLRRLFDESPRIVNSTLLFGAIKTKMNTVNHNQ